MSRRLRVNWDPYVGLESRGFLGRAAGGVVAALALSELSVVADRRIAARRPDAASLALAGWQSNIG